MRAIANAPSKVFDLAIPVKWVPISAKESVHKVWIADRYQRMPFGCDTCVSLRFIICVWRRDTCVSLRFIICVWRRCAYLTHSIGPENTLYCLSEHILYVLLSKRRPSMHMYKRTHSIAVSVRAPDTRYKHASNDLLSKRTHSTV